jgi:hypothetical protein
MKTIPLTRGYVAQVDDADYERVSAHRWYARIVRDNQGNALRIYAERNVPDPHTGRQITQAMHRFILSATDPAIDVDHRDHVGLNNQRFNLRIATRAQNNQNRGLVNGACGFKGVGRLPSGRHRARIAVNDNRIHLGTFNTAEDAARAYDAAAVKHYGEFALTNRMLGLLEKVGPEHAEQQFTIPVLMAMAGADIPEFDEAAARSERQRNMTIPQRVFDDRLSGDERATRELERIFNLPSPNPGPAGSRNNLGGPNCPTQP